MGSIQNTVVQSIELQGNRGGSGKSPLNSPDPWIAFFAGAASLMTETVVNWSVIQGAAPAKKAIQGFQLFRGLLPESSSLPGGLFYGSNPLVRGCPSPSLPFPSSLFYLLSASEDLIASPQSPIMPHNARPNTASGVSQLSPDCFMTQSSEVICNLSPTESPHSSSPHHTLRLNTTLYISTLHSTYPHGTSQHHTIHLHTKPYISTVYPNVIKLYWNCLLRFVKLSPTTEPWTKTQSHHCLMSSSMY